jgi:proteic killer suppression protein
MGYYSVMIESFKSKKLRDFWLKDKASSLPPESIGKIDRVLTRLEAASIADDMNYPGSDFHSLHGDRRDEFSVAVRANWKITFKFKNGNAYDVDYVDYH